MSDENVELIKLGLQLYNTDDFDTLFAVCDEQITVVAGPTLINAGTYRGKEALKEFLESWDEAWEEFSVEAEEIIDTGDAIVALVIQKGRGAGSGVELEEAYGFYFEIEDGLLTQWHLYRDRADAFKMAGLPVPE